MKVLNRYCDTIKRKLLMDERGFRYQIVCFMEMRQGEEYRIEKPAAYKAFQQNKYIMIVEKTKIHI